MSFDAHQTAKSLVNSRAIASGSSETPGILQDLTPEQAEKLSKILDDYLAGLEAGKPISASDLLAQHEDLRKPLEIYLFKLGELYNIAAGFAPLVTSDEAPQPEDLPNAEPYDAQPSNAESLNSSDEALLPDAPWDDSQEQTLNESSTERSPKVFGDYKLLRVAGRGGMGIVYEAEQLSLKRRVALKLLPLVSVLDARQIVRFKNEAQAAARLQHPHIVPVYAVGSVRGVHYYAMRFIDGVPLDELISGIRIERGETDPGGEAIDTEHREKVAQILKDSKLVNEHRSQPVSDYRAVIRIGIEAASALASAHQDGIIHRDIKPSNLMLDRQGKLWITDFGLARQLSDKTITATGDLLGTLRYMSPEQAAGQAALVDARSDIYSLGVTLYEMLTLQPAVLGESSPSLLRAIETRSPISLRTLRPDLPRDLITVVETAFAKSRDERYATAQQLAEDLDRVATGRPTLAKPPTIVVRTAKWAMRHHQMVSVVSSLSAVAIVCLVISFIYVAAANVRIRQLLDSALELRSTGQDATDLTFQTVEHLGAVPGSEPIRRWLLSEVASLYRNLEQALQSNPSLRPDLAFTQMRLGTIAQELGDLNEAQVHFAEAGESFERLLSADPQRPAFLRGSAMCSLHQGAVLRMSGQLSAAEPLLETSVQKLKDLTKTETDMPAYAVDLADALVERGLLAYDQGKSDASTSDFESAAELLEDAMHSAEVDRSAAQKQLAKIYSNLGMLKMDSDANAAVPQYRHSLELLEQLMDPSNPLRPSTSILALAHSNLGTAQRQSGRLEAARDSYSIAIRLQRQLTALAPAVPSYARDLSVSLNNLGIVEDQLKHPAEALNAYREAVEIQKSLQKRLPLDASIASDLGGTYHNLALLLEDKKESAPVDDAFQKSVQEQTKAVELAPSVQRYREFLDSHLAAYAEWLRKSNRPDLALAQSLIRRKNAEQNPAKLLSVAQELAGFLNHTPQSTEEEALDKKYADSALETLRMVRSRKFRLQSEDLEKPPLGYLKKYSSLSEFTRP